MHRIPIGSKFITACSHCTAKPLSSILTTCVTTITQHYNEYCVGNTVVNCFWIINNSQQALRKLHKVNESSSVRHFDSFDFSTLYTNIPHFQLKQNFEHLVDKAFIIRVASFLSVNRLNQAFWSSHPVPNCFNFGGKDILSFINFLIDNIYHYYGG